ncbi:uncharacterized protein K460DRAFT_400533 [Cucurbitaria berberidis CBS 394.84]|uniref:Uncharacterized protein n=1 Tax=Cucurbitaria berberidis CBS 394.84 TaxID=1168544 RepID=A0A9P4GPX7_9PLEO|nr:uncharacterized protein K460DRAFT_400533 [Cucurbitaria berberidis CBS 394.84]KAF1850468.1 hypothetical protein K460DRAFT_400533 [Cucurbitaria berberidis CBS 394.84]
MYNQRGASSPLFLSLEEGRLRNDDKFQLNRERSSNLGLIVVTTFETERAVTLVCNHLHVNGQHKTLNLLESLKSGLIELVDPDNKGHTIALPYTAVPQLGQLNIPAKPSPEHLQVWVGVETDTTSAGWKEVLQPGHIYGLRFSKSNDEVWGYYTDEYHGSPGEIPPAERLTVGRGDSTIYFAVHNDPATPKIFAKLEVPQKCYLSGPVPFTLIIEYSTNSERPITIDKSRSPLSVFEGDLKTIEQLIDCRDAETKEEVRWVGFFGCGDSDPHPLFPPDDDFVEILPDKPWRFECTLQNLEYEDDTVRSMFGLKSGRTYKTQIASNALSAFSRWQYGRKTDLLSGSDEEKKRRWKVDQDKQGSLSVEQIGEPTEFTVVK